MSPWQRQAFQREFIFNGLKNAKNDDYIMFSDPDEIPRPEKLLNLELKKKYGIFMQNSYCYKFNLFNRYESPWEGTRICRKKDLKSFNWLRQKIKKKNLNYPFYRIDKEKDICTFKDGGWHFNSLMSPKEISIKLKTFAHTEYSLPKFSSVLNIKKRIANLQDLFGRGHKYKKIKIDESFPLFLRRNRRRYKKFII
jgi:beta-1,4-mannosyl-glycoprotein beta-1,4-N-acetylglucosaminyltransferase